MRRELLHHRLAYLILFLGMMICIVLFMGVWPDKVMQRVVILAMTSFYFFWGVLTHLKTQTITKQVIYEYGGVACLAGILLMLITL